LLSSFFSGSGGGGGGGGGGGADRLGAEKKPITYPFFFFFGKPAFILAYAFFVIVDLDLGRDIPNFFLRLIFAYKPRFVIIPSLFFVLF
jgi:hypothetical protein